MKFIIIGKNIDVTPGLKQAVESKLGKLERYFTPETEIHVTLSVQKEHQKIEVTIPTRYAILRAEVVDDDLYAAIDRAVDKLEDQIRRTKTRLTRKNKESLAEAFLDHELFNDEEVDDDEVVRTKSIVPKEMSLDEAIMKMELLGHDFFIYTDDETNKIAVCYKRHDGGYGLIETE